MPGQGRESSGPSAHTLPQRSPLWQYLCGKWAFKHLICAHLHSPNTTEHCLTHFVLNGRIRDAKGLCLGETDLHMGHYNVDSSNESSHFQRVASVPGPVLSAWRLLAHWRLIITLWGKTIIIFLLRQRKLAHGSTASNRQSQDLNPEWELSALTLFIPSTKLWQ